MRVTSDAFTYRLIEQTIAFANLPAITSGREVEALFAGLPRVRLWTYGRDSDGNVRMDQLLEQLADEKLIDFTAADVAPLHADVRAALRVLVDGDEKRIKPLWEQSSDALISVKYLPLPPPRGGTILDSMFGPGLYIPDSVATCCWLAVRHLLEDEPAGIRARLGQCGAPACGRFNLRFTGRPQRHCSEEHRRQYDQTRIGERVRAWRKRDRERRAAISRRPARG